MCVVSFVAEEEPAPVLGETLDFAAARPRK